MLLLLIYNDNQGWAVFQYYCHIAVLTLCNINVYVTSNNIACAILNIIAENHQGG